MIMEKIIFRKDDKVKIITGKDKGKIGKIMRVDRKKARIVVENINMVKRHAKPSAQNKQGGIIENEAPIAISNVMLMCGKCVSATRSKMKILEDGKKVRVCIKCDEIIDT